MIIVDKKINQILTFLICILPIFLLTGPFLPDLTVVIISIIFLGIYSTSKDVGIFTLLLKISTSVTIILTSINAIAAPRISELFSSWIKDLNILIIRLHPHFARNRIKANTLIHYFGEVLSSK